MLYRPSECTLDVTEQFALHNIAATKVGVIVNKLFVSSFTALVDKARAETLASPGLTKQEYGLIRRRDKLDLVSELLHGRACST
jgi:hypothetical protein